MAAWAAQRPSPESDTRPENCCRTGSLTIASEVRSRSHEPITLPPRHTRAGAANHQTVPAFESPDAPAHARIKVINATRFQRFRAPNIVDVIRVAAVDDYIACLEVRR